MASLTVSADQRFRAGTTMFAYPATGGGTPTGAAVTSAVVAANSTVTFTDLADGARYVAGATVNGPFVIFSTEPAANTGAPGESAPFLVTGPDDVDPAVDDYPTGTPWLEFL